MEGGELYYWAVTQDLSNVIMPQRYLLVLTAHLQGSNLCPACKKQLLFYGFFPPFTEL